MARHVDHKPSSVRRTLMRVGLTVTAAGAVVAGGGAAASAAPIPLPQSSTGDSNIDGAAEGVSTALNSATSNGLGTLKKLPLDPLAGTGVDPLANSIGTQVADFAPVSTSAVTGPVASGASLEELPVVGPVTGVLPG
ncbi:hypothetical protein [Streptomyces endophyticus]|uniref:ATP-binding protein n=1 Tax=Streptomyces endophyticus TaxID=714166 RepID=A0ABU6F6R3_9ACTN|nr:hypothetical protein [Streptomyces endophyticus]MEB8338581.1 hypothetical protein [Streptomyces endophyticus]